LLLSNSSIRAVQTEYAFHEHGKIVEAIVRSDAQGAYTVMRDHVTGAGLRVIGHFTRKAEIRPTQWLQAQRPSSRQGDLRFGPATTGMPH
jgi:hypothetical protein